jgi:hypothetical protein
MSFSFVTLCIASSAIAQSVSQLSEEARTFAKVETSVVALTHVRVIDGTGASPRENQTIVLADGRIQSIGASSKTTPPADAQILELKKAIDEGALVGPRMYVTSPYLEGEGSFTVQMHELTRPEDAMKMVQYWADKSVSHLVRRVQTGPQ